MALAPLIADLIEGCAEACATPSKAQQRNTQFRIMVCLQHCSVRQEGKQRRSTLNGPKCCLPPTGKTKAKPQDQAAKSTLQHAEAMRRETAKEKAASGSSSNNAKPRTSSSPRPHKRKNHACQSSAGLKTAAATRCSSSRARKAHVAARRPRSLAFVANVTKICDGTAEAS